MVEHAVRGGMSWYFALDAFDFLVEVREVFAVLDFAVNGVEWGRVTHFNKLTLYLHQAPAGRRIGIR